MTALGAKKIRVLIVDDSAFMRRVISDVLCSDPAIEVVDTAKNGAEAIEKIKSLVPDVITLDVEMPVMDGIECLKLIMENTPIPVIMLSSVTKEGADSTIEALENGAIDFITKPTNVFNMSESDIKKKLIEKVKIAANTTPLKRKYSIAANTLAVEGKKTFDYGAQVLKPEASTQIKYFVAIGTSTGGPRALQDVIPTIPGDIPAAFLIVQHMPPGFTKSLADRLNSMSSLRVKEAQDGDIVSAGCAYLAPGDYHMVVEKLRNGSLRINLSRADPVGGHRPSVNVLMDSLSDTGLSNLVGVIMTGMGSDGTEGLKKMKSVNKAFIIAQDEKSSVVYGMPKSAYQSGVVDRVAKLSDIGFEIIKFVGGSV